jgi:glucose-1-phosphate adenylyltransferase
MRQVMALVLAGGGSERLSVLTAERAVSAVPFGGKYRVIDFVLSNCCHSEIRQVGILVQHAPTSLHDHIGAGRPWDLDHRGGGLMVLQPYLTRSHAGWYHGPADAIAQNWDLIEEHTPERLLVLSGDHVYRMDYRALLRAHVESGAGATVAVTRVPPEQSRRFGMATVERDGRLTALEEKPEQARTPFANMGVYVFEPAVLGERIRERPMDIVLDVLRPMLAAGVRVHAYAFEGYWEDVGTVGSYFRANLEAVGPDPRLVLHDPAWPLLTRDEERPPVMLGGHAVVEDGLVANGCRVDGTVRRAVLFPGVHVAAGAEVEDAVVMQDTRIEAGARVHHAILDKCVQVGERAIVGWGEVPAGPEHAWLEGLTLIGKDATITPGARIGRAAIVGIGAGAADLPGGELVAGAVTGNRPWYEGVV